MTDKRPSSTKLRRECFEANKLVDENGKVYMICHITGLRIDPAKDEWDAEHVIRRCLSGDDSASNLKPALREHHKQKTADDVRENAKGKRIRDKHFGVERKRSRLRKPPGMKYNWAAGRYE